MSEATEDLYPDTPQGQARRWAVEIGDAKKALEKWRKEGKEAVERFRDERKATANLDNPERRWNLFFANVSTQMALLYGQTPQASVSRRYADSEDDVARVAGEILERVVNADVDADDPMVLALQSALQDSLLPGLGTCRIRYECDWEEVPGAPARMDTTGAELAPEVQPTERKVRDSEEAEVEYIHWQDFLWSAGARSWREWRWAACKALLSREQLVKRFGEEVGEAVPLKATAEEGREQDETPWDRAEVWEIWDKSTKRVFWWVEGYAKVLDSEEDPLGLEQFFPFARPMASNITTDKYLPRPDFHLAKDLYTGIDALQTRIGMLVDAVRVAGVYDKTADAVSQLLSSTGQNDLYPVDAWAVFAEKGGIKGVVDWLPLEQIVGAVTSLKTEQERLQAQLYEVTGMSDILRGQGQGPGVTLGEQQLKARFASVRLQHRQDDFARFASDVARLKAEVICKHFEPQTILERANMDATPDAPLAEQAVALLKSSHSAYRVQVRPEALALTDFSALKQERTEVLTATTSFMQGVLPIGQQLPGSTPHLLKLLQWFLSGFKGAAQAEGIIDAAIAQAQQMPAQASGQPAQKPDTKLLAQQLKGQQELAKVDAELQADLVRTRAETAATVEREAAQAQYGVAEAQARDALHQQRKAQEKAESIVTLGGGI